MDIQKCGPLRGPGMAALLSVMWNLFVDALSSKSVVKFPYFLGQAELSFGSLLRGLCQPRLHFQALALDLAGGFSSYPHWLSSHMSPSWKVTFLHFYQGVRSIMDHYLPNPGAPCPWGQEPQCLPCDSQQCSRESAWNPAFDK